MPDVDVLVVGAGPAGAVAAWQAKQAAPELDVVLLERDSAVGVPVRCAEGVGDAGLREFVNPDGADWVSRRITDVILEAPDDTQVILANSGLGWILDRTRFDAFLAAEAAREGAAVLVGTEATGMSRNGAERWHVRVKQRDVEEV
jgi:flavin-dependent dehydrogenase